MILGIIMFEDIFLAVYLSIISGLVRGGSSSLLGTFTSIFIAFGYMFLFFVIARKGAPLLNKLLNIRSDEIFILVIFTSLFFVAGFSELIHVAEAIGALLLGLVYSETEHRERIEHLVVPFRDFFGAIFFFSFGLSIDPSLLSHPPIPPLSTKTGLPDFPTDAAPRQNKIGEGTHGNVLPVHSRNPAFPLTNR